MITSTATAGTSDQVVPGAVVRLDELVFAKGEKSDKFVFVAAGAGGSSRLQRNAAE
jgi:hypothetical protein